MAPPDQPDQRPAEPSEGRDWPGIWNDMCEFCSPWIHWVFLAAAVIIPLGVSRVILNSIVPCAFFKEGAVVIAQMEAARTLDTEGKCSFFLSPPVYRQLYEFGAVATLAVVLAIVAAVFSIRYILGSFSAVQPVKLQGRLSRWAFVAAAMALVYLGQSRHWIDPHSCISGKLIDFAVGGTPVDEKCVSALAESIPGIFAIGSLSASVKDVFGQLYPLMICAAVLVALATGYVLAKMIVEMKAFTVSTEIEKASADATRDVTFLLTLLSGLFTISIALTSAYYGIGEKVITGARVKPPPTTVPDNVLDYQDYVKAVALHWGGAGSATIVLVFLCAIVVIAYWRERFKLPPFAEIGKVGPLVFNLIAMGLPTIATQAQLAFKTL